MYFLEDIKMKTYGFIGVGNMASAIIRGLGEETNVVMYDRDNEKSRAFESSRRKTASSAADVVRCSDYIILAIKPQNFEEVLSEIAASGAAEKDKTFVSIAAGITVARITGALGDVACIRTMPNTPLMIGEGVTALCRNEKVTDEAFSDIVGMFASLGKTIIMPEKDLNAIISVTSSAPAYVYLFIKSLIDGARAQGLDYDEIPELVCAMIRGSVKMVEQSGKTPDELIRMVTSPNGTTERAMHVLYECGFEEMLVEAMKKCTERAFELSGT